MQTSAPVEAVVKQVIVPPVCDRKQVMALTGLKYEEVKRLDYEQILIAHPAHSNPKKYTGASVRYYLNGVLPKRR